MSEFQSEAAKLIRCVAGPRRVDDTIKRAIHRAARRLGWSASRAKDVWYLAARRIDAEEMDALRKAAGAMDEAKDADDEIALLRARLAALESRVALMDAARNGAGPDYGRPLVHRSGGASE